MVVIYTKLLLLIILKFKFIKLNKMSNHIQQYLLNFFKRKN